MAKVCLDAMLRRKHRSGETFAALVRIVSSAFLFRVFAALD
jgi:hypothetical protein